MFLYSIVMYVWLYVCTLYRWTEDSKGTLDMRVANTGNNPSVFSLGCEEATR